jgi:hypothetical protein
MCFDALYLVLHACAALLQALDGTLEDFSYRKCLLALFSSGGCI